MRPWWWRRLSGSLVAVVAIVALTALYGGGPPSPAAAASHPRESYDVPASGLPIAGHGYGNGIGLSQWGAYGAAKVDHLTAAKILDFYYPNTSQITVGLRRTIRVELTETASSSAWAQVAAADGLAITSNGNTTTLPARIRRQPVTAWRLLRRSNSLVLQDQASRGWHAWKPAELGAAATFSDTAAELTIATSGATTPRAYRGELTVTVASGLFDAVNDVDIEDYVRDVVPYEMPPSWPQAALKAQAVAARSYATYQMRHPRSSLWDVHADTRDQAYEGLSGETAATDKAVSATGGDIRVDGNGQVIFAAYGSADGGETVASPVAGQQVDYLPAQADPYDDAVPNTASAWTTTLTPSQIEGAYPGVGTPESITIDSRDGNGEWGGRITELTVAGSAGSEQVSGWSFALALGLRSPWWAPQLAPAAVRRAMAPTVGSGVVSVHWKAPPTAPGRAPVTGYRVAVSPGKVRVSTVKRHVRVTGLPAAVSYAVSIRPTSASGRGDPVRVSSAVRRVGGRAPAAGLADSRFATGSAHAAVLVAGSPEGRPAGADGTLGSPVLAAAVGGPLLASGNRRLGPDTREALKRVLPARAPVWLVGPDLSPSLAAQIRHLGWRPRRITADDPAGLAAAVASEVVTIRRAAGVATRAVVEVDGNSLAAGAVAASFAVRDAGVVLLTAGRSGSPESEQWMSSHRGIARHRWAIGSDAVRADGEARPVSGRSAGALSVAALDAVPGQPVGAAIARSDDPVDALATAADPGTSLLLASPDRPLARAVRAWLNAASNHIAAVTVVGGSDVLPYTPIVTGADAALLP